MSKNLLTIVPKTRINDLFVAESSSLDFTRPTHATKDPLVLGQPNTDHRFHADFYKKIGLDIVAETVMQYPYTFITEKTYRPIANGRPFIILGPYNTLQFLRSLGFMTFSSIIDESYDHVHNAEQRFSKACDSITTFVDRPIDQIIADISGIKEVLLHNQHHLPNLVEEQIRHFKRQIEID
jgi:hypothetical protein